MKSWLRIAVACTCVQGAAIAADSAPGFTPTDLNLLARVSDPQVSPNGRYVVYVQRETDLEANRGRNDLWLVDLDAAPLKPRRLTQHSANDTHPRWSVDGTSIYFLSTRAGSTQIWRLPMSGGEAVQITDYPLDVGSFKFSSGGGAHRARHGRLHGLRGSQVHARPARGREDQQGPGAHLRPAVHPALGHVARSHAFQPVRGTGECRRPRRHAGERERRARCRRAFQAGRRRRGVHVHTRRQPRGVQRAGRGPRGTLVDELRPLRGALRRQRAAEEPDRRQSGLGHPAGVPQERRPGVARDEPPRLRSRSFRHQAAPRRHRARRRRAMGSLRIAPRRGARREHAAGNRQRPRPGAAVCHRCRQRHGQESLGRRAPWPNFPPRRAAPWSSGTISPRLPISIYSRRAASARG